MKTDIHPKYDEVTVKCSCGNTFATRSTKAGEQHIELCNECHPFYTGKQKLVDAGGRVERFNKRYGSRKTKCPYVFDVTAALRGGCFIFRPSRALGTRDRADTVD